MLGTAETLSCSVLATDLRRPGLMLWTAPPPAIPTIRRSCPDRQAGILNTWRPGDSSQDSGNARVITSAAVSRVGAIEILQSRPPAGANEESRHEKAFGFLHRPLRWPFNHGVCPRRHGRSTRHGIVSYVHDGRRPRHPRCRARPQLVWDSGF